MKKFGSTIGLYGLLFVIILAAVFATNKSFGQREPVEFTYSNLIQSIQNDQVTELQVQNSSEITNYGIVRARLIDGREVIVNIPSIETLMEFIQVENSDGSINVKTPNIPKTGLFMAVLPTVVMVILMIILFSFMFQKMNGGSGGKMMSFGKSKARVNIDEKNRVTFENVAGLNEEKEELKELVEFLKEPKKFVDMGARIPKGVLLVGPPGTGKTLLAKAVAGEAYVPFFSISGSDFVEMFVGVGASRVRDLFDQAKKNSPCIVFIDEIDAVGRRRGAGLGGGHDEREQTLNQLLVEMDGFGVNEGVIVLAATNRADILDPAILRPGRFDRQVYVGRPDVKGREEILKVHAKGKPIAPEVSLEVVAKTTSGFTGADLSNLLNEAALLAARANKKVIEMSDIQSAFVKVGIGTEKKSHVTSEKEKLITAYHEAGHAIIFEILSELDPVHSISIIPTGMAGGYTMPLPGEDKMYLTKKRMEQEIVSLLGGRAAELIVIKDITTGASNDIERASLLARNMVTKYGMSDVLGPIQFGSESDEVFIGREMGHSRNYGEDVAATIDKEVKRIVETAYKEAIRIIEENIEILHSTSKLLIEKEKITGDEFRTLFNKQENNEKKENIDILNNENKKENIDILDNENKKENIDILDNNNVNLPNKEKGEI